jgi:hypothetical protein
MNPLLGRNFEAMDPLEWLACLSDHIPDPGQHRTLFYGEFRIACEALARPVNPRSTPGRTSRYASAARRVGVA